jgi:hypothetical protein
VTYRASKLPDAVRHASQAVIVTRESNPREVTALFQMCSACEGTRRETDLQGLLGSLAIGEAVVLPMTEEAGGEVRKLHLSPRLTPHVRHLAKYLDIPVQASRAFQFWRDGNPTPRRAQTLKQFVEAIDAASAAGLDGHLRRGDFSRWIEDVFGDYPLAKALRAIESDYVQRRREDVPGKIAEAVRARYDFLDPMSPS